MLSLVRRGFHKKRRRITPEIHCISRLMIKPSSSNAISWNRKLWNLIFILFTEFNRRCIEFLFLSSAYNFAKHFYRSSSFFKYKLYIIQPYNNVWKIYFLFLPFFSFFLSRIIILKDKYFAKFEFQMCGQQIYYTIFFIKHYMKLWCKQLKKRKKYEFHWNHHYI